MAKQLLRYFPFAIKTNRRIFLEPRKVIESNRIPKIFQKGLSNAALRLYSTDCPIGNVEYATIKELAANSQKLLIDVREPKELTETGQIPSSINIPLGIVGQELALSEESFKTKYGRTKPQSNTELIFHCKAGIRSLKAAETAVALGFTNVKNYKGSWIDWADHEGLPK